MKKRVRAHGQHLAIKRARGWEMGARAQHLGRLRETEAPRNEGRLELAPKPKLRLSAKSGRSKRDNDRAIEFVMLVRS